MRASRSRGRTPHKEQRAPRGSRNHFGNDCFCRIQHSECPLDETGTVAAKEKVCHANNAIDFARPYWVTSAFDRRRCVRRSIGAAVGQRSQIAIQNTDRIAGTSLQHRHGMKRNDTCVSSLWKRGALRHISARWRLHCRWSRSKKGRSYWLPLVRTQFVQARSPWTRESRGDIFTLGPPCETHHKLATLL